MRDEPLDEADDEADEEPTRPRAAINPWPLLAVLVVAILSWFGYQAWHLQREHRSLVQIRASSEAPVDQARGQPSSCRSWPGAA